MVCVTIDVLVNNSIGKMTKHTLARRLYVKRFWWAFKHNFYNARTPHMFYCNPRFVLYKEAKVFCLRCYERLRKIKKREK